MNPKLKNILIITGIGIVIIALLFFFLRNTPEEQDLVSSASSQDALQSGGVSQFDSSSYFLSLLLSVRSIKLDESIFSGTIFPSLRDSSVILLPDGDEGRVNPFAPIGFDPVEVPIEPLPIPEVNEGEETTEEIIPDDPLKEVIEESIDLEENPDNAFSGFEDNLDLLMEGLE